MGRQAQIMPVLASMSVHTPLVMKLSLEFNIVSQALLQTSNEVGVRKLAIHVTSLWLRVESATAVARTMLQTVTLEFKRQHGLGNGGIHAERLTRHPARRPETSQDSHVVASVVSVHCAWAVTK